MFTSVKMFMKMCVYVFGVQSTTLGIAAWELASYLVSWELELKPWDSIWESKVKKAKTLSLILAAADYMQTAYEYLSDETVYRAMRMWSHSQLLLVFAVSLDWRHSF